MIAPNGLANGSQAAGSFDPLGGPKKFLVTLR
jgi:hypothetical protein